MQVNAIQGSLGFTGRFPKGNDSINTAENENRKNSYDSPISNSKMRNATKSMIIGMIMLPVAGGLMNSCAKAEAYAEDDCCFCQYPSGVTDSVIHDTIQLDHRDTITIRDTIQQIVDNYDTIVVKSGYDSPVIDGIRDFFEASDIDLGDGRIPLSITWVDEIVPSYNKQLFEESSSSYDEVAYRATASPWSDEQGSFVIGTELDEPSLIKYSLNSNGQLLMMRYVPKNGVKNPVDKNDWMYSNAAVYDIDKNNKCVYRYKIDDNNDMIYNGTFEPGETAGEMKVTNPYGTDWRYTNVKVITGDAPGIDD